MRDLYRCLDEYSPPLLEALAACWDVTLPRGETLAMVRALGDAMLRPGAVDRLVSTLPPEAREALAEVALEGGAVPAQRLVLRYGALRRFGPARLLREQPWLHPEGAVEELYYRGLVYRAYGEVAGSLGDLLVVPDQLLERLPPLAGQPPEWERPLDAPPCAVRSAGAGLIEDLFAILAYLRRHSPRAVSTDPGGTPIDAIVEAISAQHRWRGGREPARVALLWRLAVQRSLILERNGLLEPAPRVRDWLYLDDAGRLAGAFVAWREDPVAHELQTLATIQCEGMGSSPASHARRNALEVLARFIPGRWYPLRALAEALKRQRPDYLRPEGEPGWFIRDVDTGLYLEGPSTWDRVEGALATALLVGPLHWLGVVDLGAPDETAVTMAFRVSDCLASLVASSERYSRLAQRTSRPNGRVARSHPPATCDERLIIRIPVAESQYERYQLERLGRWQAHDGEAEVYQMTEESLWEAYERGIRVPQIVRFLTRLCRDVPPTAIRTLQEWGAHMGRLTLTRAVVLTSADEAIMARIRSDRIAAAMLGETLSPRACMVIEGRAEDLIARLKVMHVWPHLRLEG